MWLMESDRAQSWKAWTFQRSLGVCIALLVSVPASRDGSTRWRFAEESRR